MTCFYVGKGRGSRCDELERNPHHDRISNKYGHAVVIIADGLTEEEAFKIERDTIEDYVFNLGYTIEIRGYCDTTQSDSHLTNQTWGGDGNSGYRWSDEQLSRHNRPTEKCNTPEAKEKARKTWKERYDNDEWRKRMSEINKQVQNRPEVKAAARKRYDDPKYRAKRSEALKGKGVKAVYCVTNNTIYASVGEAEEKLNVRVGSVSLCCNNKLFNRRYSNHHVMTTEDNRMFEFYLLTEWNSFSEEQKNEIRLNTPMMSHNIIYCPTNNTIYSGIRECDEKLGLPIGTTSQCCLGKNISQKYPDGHHIRHHGKDYIFYNFVDWLSFTEEEQMRILDAKPNRTKSSNKAVYCVTNGRIYKSQIEAEEEIFGKLSGGYVSNCCRGAYTEKYSRKYKGMNGHIYKSKDGKIYEFWFLKEWEQLHGKVTQ